MMAEGVQEQKTPEELEEGVQKGKLSAMIDSWSVKQRIAAVTVGIVLIFLIVNMIAIKPINAYHGNIQQKISETKEMVPKKLMILKQKDTILKMKQSFSDYWTSPGVSREEEIAEFLRIIESVSARNSLFVSNINPVQVNQEEGKPDYTFAVALEGAGQVPSIKEFIRDLESNYAPIKVESINLRSQGSDSGDLRYKISVVKLGVKKT